MMIAGRRIPLVVRVVAIGACCVMALTGAVLAGPQAGHRADSSSLLPTDSSVLAGSLRNGVGYVLRRQASPEDHVSLRMHVRAGSLHEPEGKSGVASLVARLVFAGSGSFPPGEGVAILRGRGIDVDRNKSVRVGFTETLYSLEVPSTEPADVYTAMQFLADAAAAPTFEPALVEKERLLAIDEQRIQLGASRRLRSQMLARLVPTSDLADHPPEGSPEAIERLTIDDLRAFHDARFVPGAITIVGVGDLEPEVLLAVVARLFGDLRGGDPAGPVRDLGLDEMEGRTLVATDSEFPFTFAEVLRLEPSEDPITTERGLFDAIVDRIAIEAFRLRLQDLLLAEQTPFIDVYAENVNLVDTMALRSFAARGDNASWEALVERLVREVRRVQEHGFTRSDIGIARQEIVSRARRAARDEPTMESGALARSYVDTVRSRSTIVSPRDLSELISQYANLASDELVTRRFVERFNLTDSHIVVVAPSGPDAPDEARVASIVKRIRSSGTRVLEERQMPVSLLDEEPSPGIIDEIHIGPAPGTITLRCRNGITAHHRFMSDSTELVRIVATLAGGRIDENDISRGLTLAGATAWRTPASCARPSAQVGHILRTANIKFHPEIRPGRISLAISCDANNIESAFAFLHMALSDPLIEPEAFKRWQQAAAQESQARAHVPAERLRELFYDTLFLESDPRHRPLSGPEILSINPDHAQRWLDEFVLTAPLEIAVVGEIDRADAAGLIERYIASLADRTPISSTPPARTVGLQRSPSGVQNHEVIEARTEQAALLIGFRVDDSAEARERLALDLARRVFDKRLRDALQEKSQLASQVSVDLLKSDGYRDAGLLYAFVLSVPDRVDSTLGMMRAEMENLVRNPPSDAELAAARAAAVHEHRTVLNDQRYWSSLLAQWDLQRLRASDVTEIEQIIASIDTATMQSLLLRLNTPARRIEIGVSPTGVERTKRDPPGGKALRRDDAR